MNALNQRVPQKLVGNLDISERSPDAGAKKDINFLPVGDFGNTLSLQRLSKEKFGTKRLLNSF